MDTLNLAPGYVTQGFSVARAELYHAAEWADNKHYAAGYIAGVTVKLLSKGTEYLELPVRIIEDVALTIINLVGATFNEGCRKNLSHCFHCLNKDVYNGVITAPIVYFHWLTAAIAGYHIVNAIFDFNPQLKQTADYHRAGFYRVQVMRTHGHEVLKRLDDLLPNKLRINSPSMFLNIYKLALQFNSEQLKQFIDRMDGEQKRNKTKTKESAPEVKQGWECPEELRMDKSDRGIAIKRILGLSYNIDLSSLSRTGRKGLICNMLDIPFTSEKNEIRKQRNLISLLLHPDKNKDDENCASANSTLNEVYQAYAAA